MLEESKKNQIKRWVETGSRAPRLNVTQYQKTVGIKFWENLTGKLKELRDTS